MEKRKLGKYGAELTTVGFGSWAVGGPWVFGWGKQEDVESEAAILRALELGVNWIDTAAIYGWGHSEEVVGRALSKVNRKDVFLATKCGMSAPDPVTMPTRDLRPSRIRQEIEESLRRLGTDYVDLYQFHWPDNTGTPVEESWQVMIDLQKEGKTRYVGVSNFNVELLERCEALHHVDSLQPPYSLLNRDVEREILPWCLVHGTGVIAYSPMQSGLLTGKFDVNRLAQDDWRRKSGYFQEPQLAKNLQFVEDIRPIAERHGKTVGQLAVAWTLMNPAVTAAIVGARNAAQAEQNLGAINWILSDEEMEEIQQAIPG